MTGAADLSDNCTHNLCYWKENNALIVIGQPMFIVDPKTLDTIDKVGATSAVTKCRLIDLLVRWCFVVQEWCPISSLVIIV